MDPWPAAPELPRPVIMDQRWSDAVFLHWRIPRAAAARFMPAGVEPDEFDGSAWVGLIGFRMQGAGIGTGPAIPYFGSFTEINVRLYSREPDGTRGVVFLSLDAPRLAVVLAARAAGKANALSKRRKPENTTRKSAARLAKARRSSWAKRTARTRRDRRAKRSTRRFVPPPKGAPPH